jgi:hypothetical protein
MRLSSSVFIRVALLVVAVVGAGCSLNRVNERVAYWANETRQQLPLGTSLDDARHFFKARGLALNCCVSGPPGAEKYYFAAQRKVGRVLITEYDVVILVALDSAQRVEAVRVERWGVGL